MVAGVGWSQGWDGRRGGMDTWPGTHLGVGPVGLDLDQGVAGGQQLGHLALQPHLPPGVALHGAGEGEHCGGASHTLGGRVLVRNNLLPPLNPPRGTPAGGAGSLEPSGGGREVARAGQRVLGRGILGMGF